jgi:hypothetical protein
MMNDEFKKFVFYSSFIIPNSSFLLRLLHLGNYKITIKKGAIFTAPFLFAFRISFLFQRSVVNSKG